MSLAPCGKTFCPRRQGDALCEACLLNALTAKDAEIARLREALAWALPLAEATLEEVRQVRNQAGHTDIQAGNIVGLWPAEVEQRDKARAALAGCN